MVIDAVYDQRQINHNASWAMALPSHHLGPDLMHFGIGAGILMMHYCIWFRIAQLSTYSKLVRWSNLTPCWLLVIQLVWSGWWWNTWLGRGMIPRPWARLRVLCLAEFIAHDEKMYSLSNLQILVIWSDISVLYGTMAPTGFVIGPPT